MMIPFCVLVHHNKELTKLSQSHLETGGHYIGSPSLFEVRNLWHIKGTSLDKQQVPLGLPQYCSYSVLGLCFCPYKR